MLFLWFANFISLRAHETPRHAQLLRFDHFGPSTRCDIFRDWSSHSSALLNKQLQLTAETYPDLQTDKIMGDFSKSLAHMENELAYLRKAHIDAVTVYNTRCQTFPDIIFARLFGFKRLRL